MRKTPPDPIKITTCSVRNKAARGVLRFAVCLLLTYIPAPHHRGRRRRKKKHWQRQTVTFRIHTGKDHALPTKHSPPRFKCVYESNARNVQTRQVPCCLHVCMYLGSLARGDGMGSIGLIGVLAKLTNTLFLISITGHEGTQKSPLSFPSSSVCVYLIDPVLRKLKSRNPRCRTRGLGTRRFDPPSPVQHTLITDMDAHTSPNCLLPNISCAENHRRSRMGGACCGWAELDCTMHTPSVVVLLLCKNDTLSQSLCNRIPDPAGRGVGVSLGVSLPFPYFLSFVFLFPRRSLHYERALPYVSSSNKQGVFWAWF